MPTRSAEARFIRTLGANLRRERTARGLTQERLAELADPNPRTVQKIEAGDIIHMEHQPHSVTVQAIIPTRGLIGFETDLVNCTKGHGIMSHLFKEYGPYKGEIPTRNNGVLVAMEQGISTSYSLETIQERGRLFIGAQAEIYEGMIIGENARPDDMPVNPCRAKKLSNMRSTGDGKGISLSPPLVMTLERSLEYIAPDEYVEVTPKSLRLRKKILNANQRKRAEQKIG